jgi:heptosyltransferase-2
MVKLGATGDVLRTTSFLPGLHRRWPGAHVSWLTLPESAVLFAGNRLVDEVFTTDGAFVPAAMAARDYDLVCCPDADATTVALAQTLRLRPGGQRLGFALDEAGDVVPLSEAARRWFVLGLSDARKKANRATYQEMVGAVLELPAPVADRPQVVLRDDERQRARDWLLRACPAASGAKGLLGLNSGAGRRWPKKQWTLAGQVGLVRRMHERGWITLLYGGPEEVERHRDLLAGCPPGSVVDTGTDNTLRDFASRLDLCRVLVTGDTLALHVGVALGKKVVALFGPTSAAEIELYGDGAKVFTGELDCLCCYGDCHKSPHCQDLISVDMVLAALAPFVR